VTLRNSATGAVLSAIPQLLPAGGAPAASRRGSVLSDAGGGVAVTVNVQTNDPRRVVDAIERYARISGRGATVTA
jgi:hypothetical protein